MKKGEIKETKATNRCFNNDATIRLWAARERSGPRGPGRKEGPAEAAEGAGDYQGLREGSHHCWGNGFMESDGVWGQEGCKGGWAGHLLIGKGSTSELSDRSTMAGWALWSLMSDDTDRSLVRELMRNNEGFWMGGLGLGFGTRNAVISFTVIKLQEIACINCAKKKLRKILN